MFGITWNQCCCANSTRSGDTERLYKPCEYRREIADCTYCFYSEPMQFETMLSHCERYIFATWILLDFAKHIAVKIVEFNVVNATVKFPLIFATYIYVLLTWYWRHLLVCRYSSFWVKPNNLALKHLKIILSWGLVVVVTFSDVDCQNLLTYCEHF